MINLVVLVIAASIILP